MARRRLHDRYFKEAKREGYLARSAYKLIEINDRHRIIRPGDAVLDCGCAPGSWLQVASQIVGPSGVVVGFDRTPVEADLGGSVHAIEADIATVDPARLTALAGQPAFDVVLSDMAPNTTGAGDHYPSVDLCRRVLALAGCVLKPGGNLAMKVFEGELYPDLLRETAGIFDRCKGFKPKASRDASREMYIIAHAFRPGGC